MTCTMTQNRCPHEHLAGTCPYCRASRGRRSRAARADFAEAYRLARTFRRPLGHDGDARDSLYDWWRSLPDVARRAAHHSLALRADIDPMTLATDPAWGTLKLHAIGHPIHGQFDYLEAR